MHGSRNSTISTDPAIYGIWLSYGKSFQGHCALISERTRSCSVNTSLVIDYIITYTYKTQDQSVVNRKISSVMSIIPSFHAGFVHKMYLHDKDKAVQCDLCEFWIHIKCNNLNYLDYRCLQNCDESWYCIECCSSIFPFNSLSSNKNFLTCCTSILIMIVTLYS